MNWMFVRSPRDTVANVLDCGIKVSEFESQSRYKVPFRTNTIGKGVNSLIPPPVMGEIVPLLFFYKDSFGIK